MRLFELIKKILKNGSSVVLLFCILFSFIIFPSDLYAKKSYKRVLKSWTRQKEVYGRDDFYACMKWFVTYQSNEFVNSKIDKVTGMYKYSDQKAGQFLQAEKEKYDGYYGFYISFYAYDYRYSDLSAKDSVWELQLEVDGKQMSPAKIKKISSLTPFYRSLYPYSNVWSRHYIVYFPKKTKISNPPLTLSINGPFGHSSLKW